MMFILAAAILAGIDCGIFIATFIKRKNSQKGYLLYPIFYL